MIKFLLTLFLVFVLSGCSIDWNWEKNERITQLEEKIEKLANNNDLFMKNTKCAEIWNQFFLDLRKDNEKNESLLYTWKIKYSEKLNTCVVYYSIINSANEWYKIIDVNTNEELWLFIDYYNFHDKSIGKIDFLWWITYDEYYKKEFWDFNNKIGEYFWENVIFDWKSYNAYN